MFVWSHQRRHIRNCVLGVWLAWVGVSGAQDGSPQTPPTGTEKLALKQSELADKYQRLEMLILKMSEASASEDPRRAALLKQALSQSKDNHIRLQMDTLTELLAKQQLKRAVDNQTQVRNDIRALLELLLSEDREDRLKNEQARVKEYIKELDRIIRQQKGVQGRTEGGANELQLAKDQGNVADRASELAKTIKENENPDSSDSESSESSDSDGNSSDTNSAGDSKDPTEGFRVGDRVEVETKDGKTRVGTITEKTLESISLGDRQASGEQSQSGEGQSGEGESGEGESGEGESAEGQSGEGQWRRSIWRRSIWRRSIWRRSIWRRSVWRRPIW
ncbi:MAG: hypothetical protein R3C28_19070 [Pirellulaceae bacterium]